MDKNYVDYPQSLDVCGPAPLDAKSFAFTLEELSDLGKDNYKAFKYYRGFIILCQEDGKFYQWTDDLEGRNDKLLPEDFIYPEGLEMNDMDYSNLAFNFVVFVQKGGKGDKGDKGDPGKDAIPSYVWVRYADDNKGTNISSEPVKADGTFREYLGTAYNKQDPNATNDYRDYSWSKYIGDKGVPGDSAFTWVVFSQYPEGITTGGLVEVSQDAYDETIGEYMVYMGMAYNKTDENEPDFMSMNRDEFRALGFKWMRIKGDDGHTGYVLDMSNEIHSIPTDSEGKTNNVVAYSGAESEMYLHYGNDIVPISEYNLEITKTDGLEYTISNIGNQGKKIIITDVNDMNDSGVITAKAYDKQVPKNLLATSTFSIVKSKNSASYKIELSVGSIRVQPSTATTQELISPSSITAKVYKNDSQEMTEITNAIIRYRYNHQSSPINELTVNTPLTLSNNLNPTYIQFYYYNPINGFLEDTESVPFVRDGSNGVKGDKGDDGKDGKDGKDGAPGIAGPIPMTNEWTSGVTYYNDSNKKDYVYYRATNTWYKLPDSVTSRTAGPSPDGNWVVAIEMQNVILGEMLNVGGWILSNNKLFSQAGLVTDGNGKPLYSNIVLSGVTGEIILGNNRAIFDKDSLAFRDTQGRERLVIELDETDVPAIFFKNTEGLKTWEAGKDGYKLITQGTRPPTFNTHDWVYLNQSNDIIPYFYTGSGPNSSQPTTQQNMTAWYRAGITTIRVYSLADKGDIAANANLISAYYNSQSAINPGGDESKYTPNGWYIRGYSPLVILPSNIFDQDSVGYKQSFYILLSRVQSGQIVESKEVIALTKTVIYESGGGGGDGEQPAEY